MSDRNPDDSDRRDTADRDAAEPSERDASDRTDRDPGRTDPGATASDETARTEPNIGGDDDSTETSRLDDETSRTETTASTHGDPGDPERRDEGGDSDDGGGLSGGIAVLVAAVVALAVTALAYVWVGGWTGSEVFFEDLFRVAPTVAGGGVGADWVAGNTVPVLDAAIAIVHAADVLMGVGILAILFIHWAIFRRLADRMQRPVSAESRGTVATDGGEPTTGEETRGGDSR